MSLELLMLGNVPVAQMVEQAKLAETSGYDTLWVADERFYREVYSSLAVLAQNTTRVKLGTCVTDPFARHPALTAMAIATLDEISNQRAILGIGAGISGFPELGIVRKKPAAAIREMIAVVRALLRAAPQQVSRLVEAARREAEATGHRHASDLQGVRDVDQIAVAQPFAPRRLGSLVEVSQEVSRALPESGGVARRQLPAGF